MEEFFKYIANRLTEERELDWDLGYMKDTHCGYEFSSLFSEDLYELLLKYKKEFDERDTNDKNI